MTHTTWCLRATAPSWPANTPSPPSWGQGLRPGANARARVFGLMEMMAPSRYWMDLAHRTPGNRCRNPCSGPRPGREHENGCPHRTGRRSSDSGCNLVEKVTEYEYREAAGGVEESAYKRKPKERYEQRIARSVDSCSLRRNRYAADYGR
jgi:hypothetical protein